MKLTCKKILVFLVMTILVSCSPKSIKTVLSKVERKKTSELVAHLDSIHRIYPETFYSKIGTNFQDTSQEVSFKTNIKLLKDSMLGAVITYASVPILNACISKDSLKFTNKREKCFTITNLNEIKKHFGVDFSFKNIQELLFGLPLGFEPKNKYYQIHEPFQYIISSHRKREIRKIERNPNKKTNDDYIIKYYFRDTIPGMSQIDLEIPSDLTTIRINYAKYIKVKDFHIPTLVTLFITTPKNTININLEYDKVELNEKQEVIFSIPDKYEECK
jgi:hypothetical protein